MQAGRHVIYIPKCRPGDPVPWVAFGGEKEDYEKWAPHICGICCLKMAGDTWNLTRKLSLLELCLQCLALGGFKEDLDGTIRGVFHFPLLHLACDLGMSGRVVPNLSLDKVVEATAIGAYVILSIDLARLDSNVQGGHLVLVHGFDAMRDVFTLHDCAATFYGKGENVTVRRPILENLSNRKGLVLWQNPPSSENAVT